MALFRLSIPPVPKKLPLLLIEDEVLLPVSSLRVNTTSPENLNLIRARVLKGDIIGSLVGVVPKIGIGAVGTLAAIFQVTQVSGSDRNASTILLTGFCRFQISRVIMEEPYPIAAITQLDRFSFEDEDTLDAESVQMAEDLRKATLLYLETSSIRHKNIMRLVQTAPVCALPDVCASYIKLSVQEKKNLLETTDISKRCKLALSYLIRQLESTSTTENSSAQNNRVSVDDVPTMRRIVSKKQLTDNELIELQKKLESTFLPEEVKKIAQKEYKRLSQMMPFSPEHNILRSYLELLAELPWNRYSPDVLDLEKAKKDLDADHYGLVKLKRRILEYLAVRRLRISVEVKTYRDPVLCFVGPPGVGKTSVARSIAATLGRPFVRISLGGVSNQSDIRGHRRTYVAAMPGRIIQAIKRSNVKNPVVLLDEIDKMTSGIHGDPAAALLEVLDPSQNCSFVDHYLNVPFDLSLVMFIATANTSQNLPPALKDRLELFNLPGYTHEEKLHIAQKHLLPKQIVQNGLTPNLINIPPETIKLLVTNYTREAGVRNLERKLGALCRAVAVRVVETMPAIQDTQTAKTQKGEEASLLLSREPIVLDTVAAKEILGPVIYESNEWFSRLGRPGVSVGLAWDAAGGSILLIECSRMPGRGNLMLTGHLGEILKESATIAWGWLRAHGHQYGIQLSGNDIQETDVHIHFPAGAEGKEGPSAGAAIACALFSLFSQRSLLTNVAMTGEITLQGVVLPVGGIKEKVLAAHREGFTKIIIPKQCEKDLVEISQNILDELDFVFVSNIEEVLQMAFEGGVSKLQHADIRSKL